MLLHDSECLTVLEEIVVLVPCGKVHNVGVVGRAALKVLHLLHDLHLVSGVVFNEPVFSL